MKFSMKLLAAQALIMFSTSAFSSTLNCSVSEAVNPPLQVRSIDYSITAPLVKENKSARIDLASPSLSLKFGIVTFLSQLTSPGEQVLIVSVTNTKTGAISSANGHGKVQSFTEVDNGSLIVKCDVL